MNISMRKDIDLAISTLFLLFFITSCASVPKITKKTFDSFSQSTNETLVGRWLSRPKAYEFKEDGSGIYYNDYFNQTVENINKFEYRVQNSQIIIHYDNDYYNQGNFTITNRNELTLKNLTNGSSDRTYNRILSIDAYIENGITAWKRARDEEHGDVSREYSYGLSAQRQFNLAISLYPGNPKGYYYRGWLYQEHSYYGYDAYQKEFPNDQDDLKNTAQTLADFNKAIELDPKYAEAYYSRGNLYSFAGVGGSTTTSYLKLTDLDKAISDYSKAIEIKPTLAEAYVARGRAYYLYSNPGLSKNNMDKAIDDFTKAIELSPGSTDAIILRAACYYNRKEIDKCIADLTIAIQYFPKNDKLYCTRGRLYHQIGEYEKAMHDFNVLTTLKPLAINPNEVTIMDYFPFNWVNYSIYKDTLAKCKNYFSTPELNGKQSKLFLNFKSDRTALENTNYTEVITLTVDGIDYPVTFSSRQGVNAYILSLKSGDHTLRFNFKNDTYSLKLYHTTPPMNRNFIDGHLYRAEYTLNYAESTVSWAIVDITRSEGLLK